jgi:maleate isomerase
MMDYAQYQAFEIALPKHFVQPPTPVRIGVILLSSDHSLELEWGALKNTQAQSFTTRLFYDGSLQTAALSEMATAISMARQTLPEAKGIDVLAFACTSATIVLGEARVNALLNPQGLAIPSTNPWSAAKAAFQFLNASNIAVLSPYPTAINHALYQQLVQAGFQVPAMGGLGIEHDSEVALLSQESIVEGLRTLLAKETVDVVFMPCTNLRALDYLGELEQYFGIPIITSNSALFWHAMYLAGKEAHCSGFGTLLQRGEAVGR